MIRRYHENKKRRLKSEINEIDNQIELINCFLYPIQKELEQEPYELLRYSENYKEFEKNYNYSNQKPACNAYTNEQIMGAIMANFNVVGIDTVIKIRVGNNDIYLAKFALVERLSYDPERFNTLKEGGYGHEMTDAYICYMYTSNEQKMMYHYIFSTKGLIEANKYLETIRDSINQAHGCALADEFISTLDLNDKDQIEESLHNLFCVGNEGVSDGIGCEFDKNGKLLKETYLTFNNTDNSNKINSTIIRN